MLKIDATQISICEATNADLGSIREILDAAWRWLAQQGIRQWTLPFSEEKIAGGEFHLIRVAGEPAGVFRLLWSDSEFWGEVPRGFHIAHWR